MKSKSLKNDKGNAKKVRSGEFRKIKRIQEEMKIRGSQDNQLVKNEEIVYDLWEKNLKPSPQIKLEPLNYPKVVIPHPGQSYNPNREDLRNLLQTIVDINKPKVSSNEVPITNLGLQDGKFVANDTDEDKSDGENKVSNNPFIIVFN